MKCMMFSYMFSYIASSKVQHQESLELQSWDDVGRLLRMEETKPGAVVSIYQYCLLVYSGVYIPILLIAIDPCMGYPSSHA